MKNMYNNIGKKIKGLASALFITATIAAIISGIVLMFLGESMILFGFLVMIIGPLAAWISSWMLYGFGEIIDKLCEIEQNTRGVSGKEKKSRDTEAGSTQSKKAEKKADTERIPKIKRLYSQGLITHEEYIKALEKEQGE